MNTPIVPCDGSGNAHKVECCGNTNQIVESKGCGKTMTAFITKSNPPASEFYCAACRTSRYFNHHELQMIS